MSKRALYWVFAGSAAVLFGPTYLPAEWGTYWWSKLLIQIVIFWLCLLLWSNHETETRSKKYIHNLERSLLANDLLDKASNIWHPNGTPIRFGDERHLFTVYDVTRMTQSKTKTKFQEFFGLNPEKGVLYITDSNLHFVHSSDIETWPLLESEICKDDAFGITVSVTAQDRSEVFYTNGRVGLTPGLCIEVAKALVLSGESAAEELCHEYGEKLRAVDNVSW